jgi:CCR4-NOT transcriptional complex subunit CAF120
VIQRSTLIKIEGLLGHEELAGANKGRECWMMLMPETQQVYPVFELLKWLVGEFSLLFHHQSSVHLLPALHDTFSLYGRSAGYTWDPRQPLSMWFAYPVGAQRAVCLTVYFTSALLDAWHLAIVCRSRSGRNP